LALLTAVGRDNDVVFLEPGGRPCLADPDLPMPVRGLRATAYETLQPVYDNDFGSGPWNQLLPKDHVRLDNVLFAPLVINGTPVGLLGLANSPAGFDDHDAKLAKAFAALAAVALRNSRDKDALGLSEERYRDLFDNAQVGMYRTTLDGSRVLAANRKACEVLDLTMEEMLAGPAAIRWKDPADRGEMLRQLQQQGSLSDYEVVMTANNGEDRVLLLSVTLDPTEKTTTESVIDITDRKRAATELAKTADALARSNEELEQFAYVASHDLQEPLRMIASYLQLLERRYQDKLDQNANDFIGYAVEGATRLKQQINDLLSFSRVSTRGREFTLTSSGDALDGALQNLAAVIQERDAQIDVPTLPEVYADRAQLVQLFQNLVGNGIKFSRQDRPNIRVLVEREDDEYHFRIQDDGIGIELAYHERIFVIFQRLHGKLDFPGTGIGLAVCKRIVERHHGRIWVESALGSGSTFHFTLPAVQPTGTSQPA